MNELSPRDRVILAFEERVWAHDGAKVDAIRTSFGMTPTTYYHHVLRIAGLPAAVAEFPMLTKRIQRQVREAAAARASSRFKVS